MEIKSGKQLLEALKYYDFEKVVVDEREHCYKIHLPKKYSSTVYSIVLDMIDRTFDIDRDYFVFRDLKWYNNFFSSYKLK